MRQYGFLRVGKVKKDIKIKHEKQIDRYITGSSESHWNVPTCVAKRWWEERGKKKKFLYIYIYIGE